MFSKEFLLLHTHMHIVFLILHLNMLWFDIIKFYIKNATVLTHLWNFVHGQWINYFSCSVCILKTWGDLKIVTEQYDIFYYLKKYCHMTPTAKRIACISKENIWTTLYSFSKRCSVLQESSRMRLYVACF